MTASISPEQWINLLSVFGPCAFFVFMFLIGLRMARQNKGLTPEQQSFQNIAFSVVWISIFVFAALSIIAYWKVNFPAESQIKGYIRNFEDPETINTRDNLFLKRHYGAYTDYDYEFRIIGARPVDGYVSFLLQKTPKDSNPLRYQIPLRSQFYKGTLDILYERDSGKMTLMHGSEKEELLPHSLVATTDSPPARTSLINI